MWMMRSGVDAQSPAWYVCSSGEFSTVAFSLSSAASNFFSHPLGFRSHSRNAPSESIDFHSFSRALKLKSALCTAVGLPYATMTSSVSAPKKIRAQQIAMAWWHQLNLTGL